jgi:SAM-dependent methyltransferase
VSESIDFSPLVEEYAKYRVGYGEQLFQVLADRTGAPLNGAALDLAGGTGLSTYPLAALVDGLVIGTDIGLDLLKCAKHDEPESRFAYARADATNLPFDDGSFQVVSCAQALHWIPHDEVVSESFRVLAGNGWFFAYWKYPAPDEPYQLVADRLIGEMLGREIKQGYSLKRKPDLRAHGFVGTSVEEIDFSISFTIEGYLGFMRSRKRIRDLTGDRYEEFMRDYEAEVRTLLAGKETFEERNIIYLFAGQKPNASLTGK